MVLPANIYPDRESAAAVFPAALNISKTLCTAWASVINSQLAKCHACKLTLNSSILPYLHLISLAHRASLWSSLPSLWLVIPIESVILIVCLRRAIASDGSAAECASNLWYLSHWKEPLPAPPQLLALHCHGLQLLVLAER